MSADHQADVRGLPEFRGPLVENRCFIGSFSVISC